MKLPASASRNDIARSRIVTRVVELGDGRVSSRRPLTWKGSTKRRSDTQRMAKLHTLQAHGSGGLVSMRNANTAAGRAAHAPGDDPLARALELNSRALRVVRPSGHKCGIPAAMFAASGCYCFQKICTGW